LREKIRTIVQCGNLSTVPSPVYKGSNMADCIEFECRDGTAWITLNRPTAKNALTAEMMDDLLGMLNGLADNPKVRIVVIGGNGSDFCSGADVGAMATLLTLSPEERTARFHRSIDERIVPLLHAFRRLSQPIVASIRGYAIGIGVQFALLSDLIIASETAQFVLPQVKLAHTLDHGESWLLPRRIGLSKAMQLCLLGEAMNAVDAERFGLTNWTTTDGALEKETEKLVARLLRGAPDALRRTKALLGVSETNGLERQLEAEGLHVGFGAASDNFVEAVRAFNEKRAPRFTGV
jgi:2-(1,2-epoxy-1,2-dihydrophenyl)acetyl-CoA isomerase